MVMASQNNPNKRKRPANLSETSNSLNTDNNNYDKALSTTDSRKRAHVTRDETQEKTPAVVNIRGSSQVINIDDSDDDEIPYTHSRSQSPLFVSSSDVENEATAQRKASARNLPQKKSSSVPAGASTPAADVITIDDDDEDDMREYYVISDGEEEEDGNDAEGSTMQKTVSQQLTDNVNLNPSNMNCATCAVCFDAPVRTFFLPCGHLYCEECVFKALSSIKTSTTHGGPCALCRTYTPYNKVRGLKLKKKPKVLEGR